MSTALDKTTVNSFWSSVFGVIFFINSPLVILIINFTDSYRIHIYATIAACVILYTLIDQFFHVGTLVGRGNKTLISLALLNLILLGLIVLTGIFSSSFFFCIYVLLLVVALVSDQKITSLETIIIIGYLFIFEFQVYGNFARLSLNDNVIPLTNLFSVMLFAPLAIGISNYVQKLKLKEETLNNLRLILAEEETEDEILLNEITEGIMVLDESLKVVKISRAAEVLLGVSSKYILGEELIKTINFLDPLTKDKLDDKSGFVTNLFLDQPKNIKWEVSYKNEYGKYVNFIIEQRPLYNAEQYLDGMLIFINIKKEGVSVADILNTFNEFLYTRLSSLLSVLNFKIGRDDASKHKYMELLINSVNDANLFNSVDQKTLDPVLIDLSLKKELPELLLSNNMMLPMKISGTDKADNFGVKIDQRLFRLAMSHLVSGSLPISNTKQCEILLDRDTYSNKVQLKLHVRDNSLKPEELQKTLKPFYQGDIELLNKFGGTGLEIPIASGLFRFLNCEFFIEVGTNEFWYVILFSNISKLNSAHQAENK